VNHLGLNKAPCAHDFVDKGPLHKYEWVCSKCGVHDAS
jgi:hypothetical protein